MMLFRGKIGSQQQRAVLNSFKPRAILINYFKKHLFYSAMQSKRITEELVQIESSQMFLHDQNRYGFFLRPMIDLYLAQWFSSTLEKGASEEERADIDEAIGQLKKYEKVYNLMEYCSDLAYAARRLYNMLLKNSNVPQAVYRYSESSSVEGNLQEIEAIFGAYQRLLQELEEKAPEWRQKVVEEVGKEYNILSSSFSEHQYELIKQNCPSVKEFVSQVLSQESQKQLYFK